MPALTSILVTDLIGTSIPAIDGNFTALNAAASVETAARTSADTSLATSITAEASSRTAADASLTTALSAEVSLTASRDTSLATAISSGDTSLTAALSTAISTEAGTRSTADSSLTTRLSVEESTRSAAVAALPTTYAPISHTHTWSAITGSTPLTLFGAGTALQIPRLNSAGTGWEMATISAGGGDMLKSDNLSGLTNYVTARSNLGLGTAALAATGDFAPASLSATVSTAASSLTTRIGTEESSRGTADSSLTTRISTEESVRASVDTSLAAAISAGGMTNPMTTAGDLIVGGTAGAPGRLAIGANATVLTSNGTSASWQTPSGGSGGGTKTYSAFRALDGNPPASAYATLDTRNSIPTLDFDDTAAESVFFVGIMPEAASLGSGLVVRIHWAATSATSGNVRWRAEFERSNTDLDSDSFDTATEATGTANGTSGIETVTAITCTTIDGITAGDLYRLRITRVSTDTTNDTMTGDAELIAVEVRSAA